eukprot:6488295-Amphidinium_carterae.1
MSLMREATPEGTSTAGSLVHACGLVEAIQRKSIGPFVGSANAAATVSCRPRDMPGIFSFFNLARACEKVTSNKSSPPTSCPTPSLPKHMA